MPVSEPVFPLHVVEEDGRTTVRFPAGTTLTDANAEELATRLAGLTEGKEHPHLLVDLGGVSMLTSVILTKFMALNGRVRGRGGRLTLFNPNAIVHQVFKVTRLDTILEVHPFAHSIPA